MGVAERGCSLHQGFRNSGRNRRFGLCHGGSTQCSLRLPPRARPTAADSCGWRLSRGSLHMPIITTPVFADSQRHYAIRTEPRLCAANSNSTAVPLRSATYRTCARYRWLGDGLCSRISPGPSSCQAGGVRPPAPGWPPSVSMNAAPVSGVKESETDDMCVRQRTLRRHRSDPGKWLYDLCAIASQLDGKFALRPASGAAVDEKSGPST